MREPIQTQIKETSPRSYVPHVGYLAELIQPRFLRSNLGALGVHITAEGDVLLRRLDRVPEVLRLHEINPCVVRHDHVFAGVIFTADDREQDHVITRTRTLFGGE